MENKELKMVQFDEKSAHAANGWLMVLVNIVLGVAAIVMFTVSDEENGALMIAALACALLFFLILPGYKMLRPNEAYVFTLFGKYFGTLRKDGFYWVIPFCSAVNAGEASLKNSHDTQQRQAKGQR